MEPTKVAQEIEKRIVLLAVARKELAERAKAKANAIAAYDKKLGLTMLRMRNGVEMAFEGEKVKNIPTTTTEKIAKAMCWQKKLAMEEAMGLYAVADKGMNCLQVELNGYQSIFRHLDET